MKNISNERTQRILTTVAFAIVPMSGFATDIYIPSMPSMGSELKITSLQVQLPLTAFLISYGVAQLFIGAFLDTFGRYKLGLTALFVFTVASITIANTDNIYLIYIMRVVHGLTVATIVVAKRAYFVDVYKGEQLKSYLSIFTIIWSVGPIVAPFIGGYLQAAFRWHSNFYFLAGMAGIIGILEALFIRETLASPAAFNIRRIAATYYEMITTLRFILGLVILRLAYSTVMIYNLTGPFIIEHKLGMSPVIIGYCSLLLGFACTIGGLSGKATVKKPFFSKLLLNLLLQLPFSIAMVLCRSCRQPLYNIIFCVYHTCCCRIYL